MKTLAFFLSCAGFLCILDSIRVWWFRRDAVRWSADLAVAFALYTFARLLQGEWAWAMVDLASVVVALVLLALARGERDIPCRMGCRELWWEEDEETRITIERSRG